MKTKYFIHSVPRKHHRDPKIWHTEPFDEELELWTLADKFGFGFAWALVPARPDAQRHRQVPRAEGIARLREEWKADQERIVLAGTIVGSSFDLEVANTVSSLLNDYEPVDLSELIELISRVCERMKALQLYDGSERFDAESTSCTPFMSLIGAGLILTGSDEAVAAAADGHEDDQDDEDDADDEDAEDADDHRPAPSPVFRQQTAAERQISDLSAFIVGRVPRKPMVKLLERYIDRKVQADEVVQKVLEAAEAASVEVPRKASRYSPCPLCGGKAYSDGSKGFALPAGLTMHLKGERARPCVVWTAAVRLCGERGAFSDRLQAILAEASPGDDAGESEEPKS